MTPFASRILLMFSAQYTIAIDNNGPRAVENTKLGDRSVLSQKTMEQIRVEMSSVVWNAAGSPGGGARGC